MTPWAEEFAEWRRAQALQEGSGLPSEPYPTDNINGLEETKGCAVLDSGATINCSSTTAAGEIQMQRLNQQELGVPIISQSDRRSRFADGRVDEAQKVVEQLICALRRRELRGREENPVNSIETHRIP